MPRFGGNGPGAIGPDHIDKYGGDDGRWGPSDLANRDSINMKANRVGPSPAIKGTARSHSWITIRSPAGPAPRPVRPLKTTPATPTAAQVLAKIGNKPWPIHSKVR